jgi:hypothetical protein
VLAAPYASDAARGTVLGILESLLDASADAALQPHMRQLLDSLRALVAAVAPSGGAQRVRKRPNLGLKVCTLNVEILMADFWLHAATQDGHWQGREGSLSVCSLG